ncbi:MAG: SAM-dependent chlorinase/fluorinase [Verrucomicrobiota bacterium]|nr:SAM-dependent chlorinase/fluorinase [Verrucomicrobiota bacterium]
MRAVTLTTDFGTRDWFVGTMKGVILAIEPRAVVVDLTHEVPPGDPRAGAFALMAGCRFFPKGTVHVAVVDPGVGGPRRAIAAQTADYWFVGPDNGVLSWALARERVKTVRQLEARKYFLEPVSRTFHGRDIFAPVAAHLCRGLPARQLGRELKDWVRLPWPEPVKSREVVRGEVLYVDRFGNAITNIASGPGFSEQAGVCEVIGRRKASVTVAEFYGAAPPGRPVAVMGSSGFLEIAVNGGSAARKFGLKPGDTVIVRAGKHPTEPRVAPKRKPLSAQEIAIKP